MARVLFLYDILRLDEKMLLKAFESVGVTVEKLHIPSTVFALGPSAGVEASIAVERAISFSHAVTTAAIVESWGVPVVNTSFSIAVAGDKVWSTAILASHGLPVPRTFVAYSVESTVEAAGRLGYPVVLKTQYGSWGRLLALAGDAEAVRAIAEHREALGGSYSVNYVQEYVRKPGRDIRALCVGERVPAAIYRVSSSWITNAARGGRAEPVRVDGELEDLAVRACKALGVEVGGVDIVEDPEKGYLVLEVNAVPEYKNVARATGVDVAGEIAEYVVAKAKR